MENTYELMWKENRRWLEKSVAYYQNELNKQHPDYKKMETLQAVFQFMIDSLDQTERFHADRLKQIIGGN